MKSEGIAVVLEGPLDFPFPADLDLALGSAAVGWLLAEEGVGNREDCDDSRNGLNSH